ncbi:MAG: hypothetical protein IKZ45_03365 [Fibrobacter sp.]|jgi:hypothetical protein|nr:hypothetical protein [Fibrobacter sp.]
MKRVIANLYVVGALLLFAVCLFACAGERQGAVCSEIQYRLDTQTYSPDQRAYIENELRECREEEAKKRGADAQTRQGIYERYAASNQAESAPADSSSGDISVSKALQDSSGVETVSIYDRYKAVDSTAATPAETTAQEVPDTSAAEAGSFQ